MKKALWILVCSSLLCATSSLFAQPIGFQSLGIIGDIWDDEVKTSVQDSDGNIIVLGTFYWTADFDPGPGVTNLNAPNDGRAYLLKLDSLGNFVWAKNFGNNDQTAGQDVAVDDFGNIYVTGQLRFLSDFDPGPGTANLDNVGSAAAYDCFIAKYNSNGDFIWVKRYGNLSNPVIGRNITVANDNQSIYVSGSYAGTTDFDPSVGVDTLTSFQFTTSTFIQHLDSSGNHLWVKPVQTTAANSSVTPQRIRLDSADNIYLLGNFFGTVDFDPNAGVASQTSAGPSGQDMFISKMDSTGALSWNEVIGASNNWDFAYDMYLQNDGNLLITGGFGTTVDFDPGPGIANLTSSGFGDIFILRLSNQGNYLFAKKMGQVGNDTGYRIIEDEAGNILVAGNFRNTVDFDPGAGSAPLTANPNTWSMFVAHYDSIGNYIWAEGINGSQRIYPEGLHYLTNEEIFVAGRVDTVYDFDPGPNVNNNVNNGDEDIFIYRVKECTADSVSVTVTACDSFMVGGQMVDSSGNYIDTLTNAFNCDSVVYINLTILNATSDTLQDTACVSYLFGGMTLTASGTYVDTLVNAALCDSLVVLELIVYQDTMVAITDTACGSYDFNGTILSLSGNYADTLTTSNGCDSIIQLDLTINQSTQNTIVDAVCDEYVFNNQVYTSSGIYIDTLVNAVGCDSVVTLDLTILSIPITILTETACDTFEFAGQLLTSSGTYFDTLVSSISCDSIIQLNLTIPTIPVTSITENACDSFLFGEQMLTSSGTYFDTLTSSLSCDSVVELNLVITAINLAVTQAGFTLSAEEGGAEYQWINCVEKTAVTGATEQSFTPTLDGSYAVIISKNNCSDTSDCFDVSGLSIDERSAFGVSIYPNPVDDLLYVSYADAMIAPTHYVLSNSKGKMVERGLLNPEATTIDLSSLAPGVYFFVVQAENGAQRQFKVMKQ